MRNFQQQAMDEKLKKVENWTEKIDFWTCFETNGAEVKNKINPKFFWTKITTSQRGLEVFVARNWAKTGKIKRKYKFSSKMLLS